MFRHLSPRSIRPLFCSQGDSICQSIKPHGQNGVPQCQVGVRKHSSCCLVWVPCVGAGRPLPSPVLAGIKELTLTDKIMDIHYCGPFAAMVHYLGAQMHKKSKHQSKSYYKTADVKRKRALSLLLWLRCVCREALPISIYFICSCS